MLWTAAATTPPLSRYGGVRTESGSDPIKKKVRADPVATAPGSDTAAVVNSRSGVRPSIYEIKNSIVHNFVVAGVTGGSLFCWLIENTSR
jgi:hypothetical protein